MGGYNGVPSTPSDAVFAYDVDNGQWLDLGRASEATMDHRGLAIVDGVGWIVGGMRAGQRVSDGVVRVRLPQCPGGSAH